MPARAIKNNLTERMLRERIPTKHCIDCVWTCPKADIPFCIGDALLASARGDVENGMVFCGGRAWELNKMEKVADIFEELTGV